MKINRILSFLFILLFLFIFNSCPNAGVDTADVISANRALERYFDLMWAKYSFCTSIGFKYASDATPFGALSCSDSTFDNNEGNYVWLRDYNNCVRNISLSPCPDNNTSFAYWVEFMLDTCKISEAYYINSYKPFQGKIIGEPRNLDSTVSSCL
ncbi:hypothetical protein [Leptospira sp. GIMC2001]|uniref:hypothetical protein n=1 Tax=Leptospira sp. GIMC2001 TaxID=1513297 RepID=UPI00234905CB|nr:hypothetical protein [Leptospira sp. GIMC2001]WCL50801.1 hypothetical protein O4O04_08310 [Leptospira sp. GIMC2001]